MIRETLSTNSRYAYTLVSAAAGVDFESSSRLPVGAASRSEWTDRVGTRAPYWVRVRRIGNVFTAYVSPDGHTWRQHGNSVTITMGSTVYAGLAVTSHLDGTLATAVFSNVNYGPVGTTHAADQFASGHQRHAADGRVRGVQYAFTPNATDANGNTLTYSITNRPSWATFNASTGRLVGYARRAPTSARTATS